MPEGAEGVDARAVSGGGIGEMKGLEEALVGVERTPLGEFKLEPEAFTADQLVPTTTGLLVGTVPHPLAINERGPIGTGFEGLNELARTGTGRPDDGRIPRGFDDDPDGMYTSSLGSGGGDVLRGIVELLDILLNAAGCLGGGLKAGSFS